MGDLECSDSVNIEDDCPDNNGEYLDELSTVEHYDITNVEDDSLSNNGDSFSTAIEGTSDDEDDSSSSTPLLVSISSSSSSSTISDTETETDDDSDSCLPPLVRIDSSTSSESDSDSENESGNLKVENPTLTLFRNKRFKNGAQFRDLPNGRIIYREIDRYRYINTVKHILLTSANSNPTIW